MPALHRGRRLRFLRWAVSHPEEPHDAVTQVDRLDREDLAEGERHPGCPSQYDALSHSVALIGPAL